MHQIKCKINANKTAKINMSRNKQKRLENTWKWVITHKNDR